AAVASSFSAFPSPRALPSFPTRRSSDLGYDSWNSPAWVEDMETRLGYTRKENLLPFIMGAKTLSAPMKVLRADLAAKRINYNNRSEEHTSELQSRENLVCRLLLEKQNHN